MSDRFRLLTTAIFLGVTLLVVNSGCATQPKVVSGISRLGFSIQVGAFAEVKNAERLTTKLQSHGIEAFYFRKDSGVYVVRFGDYRNRETARKGAEKLVAEKLIGSYFIASPEAVFKKASKAKPVVETQKPPQGVARSKPSGDMGAVAARTAERFVGIPYRWGGDNVVEGMDCSGFVRAVYNLCGINIPRTSAEQFRVGDPVSRSELQDGDLVFFGVSDKINHVGIYVGAGRFVHAPRRGDEIKISALDESYFSGRFIGAKRYF
jgi:cell wall-associated NlpC family hydrolase